MPKANKSLKKLFSEYVTCRIPNGVPNLFVFKMYKGGENSKRRMVGDTAYVGKVMYYHWKCGMIFAIFSARFARLTFKAQLGSYMHKGWRFFFAIRRTKRIGVGDDLWKRRTKVPYFASKLIRRYIFYCKNFGYSEICAAGENFFEKCLLDKLCCYSYNSHSISK